tara:strand:- start:3083 stop:4450 length:1368 start_codon:yes stop_codon:yes gene_type:complete
MLTASSELAEAVVFFNQGQATREMLWSEFEAILDAVVPMMEFANSTAHAVYVRINSKIDVAAAVFFSISYDADGRADNRWNIPLQQLADSSARGPDMGSGPILLACYSQCSIAAQQKNLWDPSMDPKINTFAQLRKVIASNRLGLVFEAEEVAAISAPADFDTTGLQQEISKRYQQKFEQELRSRMAQMMKEQRLRIATLTHQNEESTQVLQHNNLQCVDALRLQIEQRDSCLKVLEQRNQVLKETIVGQNEKIQGQREYFEHKLESRESDGQTSIKSMQDDYKLELEAKVLAATAELKDSLQMRDFELIYRSEQESVLREELTTIQAENQSLIANNGSDLLGSLSDAGLSFVAYHPGAGHITVPVKDIKRYMASKQLYAAETCGVTMGHYQQWLSHYHRPVCAALTSKGDLCGARIAKNMDPREFHVGDDDRCAGHQTSVSRAFSLDGQSLKEC